jgi:hypothetical protein
MRHALAALLLAATTVAPGCWFVSYGKIDPLSSGAAFDDAQRRFTQLVRWGQWEKASEMVAPDSRSRFAEVMKSLSDVRFTDWEIVQLEMGEGFHTAHVVVRVAGYRESTLTHHEARMAQEWERKDGISSHWIVRPALDEVQGAFAQR